MDLKVVLIALTLMTVLCFFSMASSAATPTIDYIHPEDGFYADRRTPLWMDVQALLSFKKHINDPLENSRTGQLVTQRRHAPGTVLSARIKIQE